MASLLSNIDRKMNGSKPHHSCGVSYVVPIFSREWRVINDDVMGGVSSGVVTLASGHIVFNGHISQDNNGGFSSAVLPLSLPLKAQSKVKLSFIGDGLSYQLRLRTKVNDQDISYKVTFETTANSTQTITANFSDFVANFRGRDITSAPKLEASDIDQISILLRHDQTTDFTFSLIHAEFI